MPAGLRVHYRQELEIYKSEISKADFQQAWRQLERAHIIGQPWFVQHTYIHWLMLKFGIKIRNKKEILGQLPRLLVGGIKSFVGIIPTGNTGGANVPPLRKMEIPEELKNMMRPYKDI
jgi:hypothetical protein